MTPIPTKDFILIEKPGYSVYFSYYNKLRSDRTVTMQVVKLVNVLGMTFKVPAMQAEFYRSEVRPAEYRESGQYGVTYRGGIADDQIDQALLDQKAVEAIAELEEVQSGILYPDLVLLLTHIWTQHLGPAKWRILFMVFMIACTVFTLGNIRSCAKSFEQAKVQAVADHDLWVKKGCFVYKSECGSKYKYACEIKAHYETPFTIGEYRITPYSTCQAETN